MKDEGNEERREGGRAGGKRRVFVDVDVEKSLKMLCRLGDVDKK